MNTTIIETLLNHAEPLEAGEYKLIPAEAEDTDFIINLAIVEQYCVNTAEALRESYLAQAYAVWIGTWKDKVIGVAIIHHVKVNKIGTRIFTFDAFEIPQKNASSSYMFGKMIMAWADKKGIRPMHTAHNLKNRAATIACLRLGFKKFAESQGNILMRRN